MNPDPAQRPTAEQALAHSWLTSHAPSAEHDLSGLRENFDARARWRHAIGAARLVSRLANGAKNKSRPVSSDEESDYDAAQWRQNTETTRKHLGVPSSPDLHKPRLDLATIAAAARKKSSLTISPLSSASIISLPDDEDVDSETEKARDRIATAEDDRMPIQTTTLKVPMARCATPRQLGDDSDSDEAAGRHVEVVCKEVEPRMPGWLDLEVDAGRAAGAGVGVRGAAGAAARADDLDNCNVVGALGNLWRRMQLST
jgi:hypothetical protein